MPTVYASLAVAAIVLLGSIAYDQRRTRRASEESRGLLGRWLPPGGGGKTKAPIGYDPARGKGMKMAGSEEGGPVSR